MITDTIIQRCRKAADVDDTLIDVRADETVWQMSNGAVFIATNENSSIVVSKALIQEAYKFGRYTRQ